MSLSWSTALIATVASVIGTLDHPANAAERSSERTILLVDDHDVLYRSGTERIGPKPTRHPQAVIPADKPWEMLIGYTSVYRNPSTGKYQLWYQAYAGGRGGDRRLKCVLCYAESDDGLTFTKPELNLFPFNGEPSNIVLDSNAGTGDRYGASVLYVPDEPDPAKRYKLVHYDWSVTNGREEPGLQVAFSPDGIHWTKYPGTLSLTSYGRYPQPPFTDEETYTETPVEGKPPRKRWNYPLTMSDVMDVFFDPVNGDYVVNAKMWIDGPDGGGAWKNVTGQVRSKDLLTWSDPEFLFGPDDADGPFVEFHGAATFYYKQRYFSLVQVMDRRYDLLDDIELATSVDGKKWDRPFRKEYLIARTEPGLFDSHSIWSSTPPVFLENEIRFYYGAYNEAPRNGVKAEARDRSGIGFVSIPRDRFGGVRPLPTSQQTTLLKPLTNVGQVTLKPIDLSATSELVINADASQGAVRVEVLNDEGYRVRGFSQEDAVAIRGDVLAAPATWSAKNLADLPAGDYMLRIHLDNATLYAVTLK